MAKHRSSMEINQEFVYLVKYVRKAKKTGRRYVDMLKAIFIYQHPHDISLFDAHLDRNLLNVHMKNLKKTGIWKNSEGRYIQTDN